jgi:hypothetical protein
VSAAWLRMAEAVAASGWEHLSGWTMRESLKWLKEGGRVGR